MFPWARWCVNHKLTWALRGLAWALFPFYLAPYVRDAISDMRAEMRNLK